MYAVVPFSNLRHRPKSFSYVLGLFLFSVTIFSLSNAVTIMSVDFGSEWMKIAVVAPGIPMEIALNHESKRKTPVAISFRDGERSFGDAALSDGMKSPAHSYTYLVDLLGKKVENPLVEIHKERFPYYKIEADSERGTVVFRHDEETTYSVEELVAQILNYARELAMAYTNQKIKDIVITVPPFFNQAERRALLSAAELAGLKVLSLMNTNAAVALNYGMFRRKEINETAQNILFFDMGASSTIATIASYQTIKTKDRGYTETNPQVSILGVGFDRTLGGLEMQLRLRDFLGKKFNEMKKTPNDVFKSPRGMAKLMKEAGKLKTVLSANTEHLSQIEGVLDDKDFRLMVKREDFEELCQDLFDRVRGPVDAALVSAAIDIKEIHQFIIIGGNTRVPKVQSILQDIWGKELGKNINADEAAALGAVYRAADLGQGFKVMKFHVKEAVIYPIEVDFERQVEKDGGSTSSKTVKRSLFALANSYPQKKVMTFNKHIADFGFSVNYGDLSHLSKKQTRSLGVANVSYVMVEGVSAAFKKNLNDGADSKGIKAHFSMDDSGILTLTGVEAIFEKNITVEVEKEEESTLSKIGSTLSKLFSGSDDDDIEDSVNKTNSNEADNKTKEDKKENTSENKVKEKKETKKDKEKETTPRLVTVKEDLNFTISYLDLKPMSADKQKESKDKLKTINSVEETRKEKERLKNTLESYILDTHHKLSQEDYEAAAREETRNELKQLASQLEEWLYDEGYDVGPSEYKERLRSLEKLFEPIKARVREHKERPEALKALHDMINVSSIFLHRAQNGPQKEKWFTDVELKTLDELMIDTQKWIEEKEEEQDRLDKSSDPVLTLMSVAEKIGGLDREIKYLVNKGRIAKAKKEKEEAEAKIKEAEEKAKAEKEAREAQKNKTKEEEEEAEDEDNEELESDSRQEPPLPVEEEKAEIPEKGAEENEGEKNRRKDEDEEELDENISTEEHTHSEL